MNRNEPHRMDDRALLKVALRRGSIANADRLPFPCDDDPIALVDGVAATIQGLERLENIRPFIQRMLGKDTDRFTNMLAGRCAKDSPSDVIIDSTQLGRVRLIEEILLHIRRTDRLPGDPLVDAIAESKQFGTELDNAIGEHDGSAHLIGLVEVGGEDFEKRFLILSRRQLIDEIAGEDQILDVGAPKWHCSSEGVGRRLPRFVSI